MTNPASRSERFNEGDCERGGGGGGSDGTTTEVADGDFLETDFVTLSACNLASRLPPPPPPPPPPVLKDVNTSDVGEVESPLVMEEEEEGGRGGDDGTEVITIEDDDEEEEIEVPPWESIEEDAPRPAVNNSSSDLAFKVSSSV